MERVKHAPARLWKKLAEGYSVLTAHRYTTVAGTLSFFLILSLAPFLFWLTLLFGRRIADPALLDGIPLFDWARGIFALLFENAAEAGTGAGIVFLGTTLWSSTGFFYHLRRSGEILYGTRRKKHGWKVRLSSLAYTLCLLLCFAVAGGAFFVFGIAARFLPPWIALSTRYLLILAVGFFVAWLLNAYICPYKCRPSDTALGSFITALLWLAASGAFSLYLTFASPEKLYGALALAVVFLLWLYWMMICFTAGAVYNRVHTEGRRGAQKRL